MSSSSDDTILPPPRRSINPSGLDRDTVLPSQNAPGIHATGEVIDSRYTVIREIGRGGMGVVYEVEDAVTGDRYAVKRLLPEYSSRSEIVEVFRSEGAASMRFTNKSPRFVTTQTVNLENDIPYIVLQLIKQPTLRTILQSTVGGRLLLAEALPILRDIAFALSELHALGYVHRDLKPENIFVYYSDGNPSVMLVDFGLTKDIDYATRTMMRGAGTERYASPEQMRRDGTTPATDVYAFGVITYEVLTGELPRYGESLTDYVPDASESLVSLVSGCLAGRVDKRIANGAALKRLLCDVLVEGSVDGSTIDDADTRTPSAAPAPLRLPTILSFPDLQVGADVTVDGESLPSGVDYQCEIDEGSTKSVSVIATWEGVDLYRGSVVLRGGENQAVTTRKAYRVDCDVPEWCDVKDANRVRVVFPVWGVVANPSVTLVYSLGFQGTSFEKLSVVPEVGIQQVGIDFGLGTVRVQDVPATYLVRINGDVVGSEFTLPIGIGKSVSLSVRIYDVKRKVVFTEVVRLSAGETMVICVPLLVMETESATQAGETESRSTVRSDGHQVVLPRGEDSSLTRRLVIGGGIAAALGGGGLMLNKLSPISKGLNTPASEKLKVDAQLTETSTIYRTAARGIRRQYPRLADYVESLCVIPARDFQMGSVKYDDEKPVHKVSLSSFGLGATPVTVALWEEYAIAKLSGVMPPEPNPSGFDGAQKFNIGWKDLDHPIVNVSWDDCRDFCAWASEVSGIALDLPSEAQWEYACRGGVSSLEFPWGGATDDVSVRNFLTANVWCSDAKLGDRGGTGSVNRTTRIWRNHPWKLIDMVGNVWEWCVDYYDPEWYGRSQATGPDVVNRTFAPTQTVKFVDGSSNERPTRCVRGGSWYSTYPVNFRCANRFRNAPDDRYFIFGFRLSAGSG